MSRCDKPARAERAEMDREPDTLNSSVAASSATRRSATSSTGMEMVLEGL